jgi:dTMP kinase
VTLYLDMPPEVSQKLLNQRYQGDTAKKDIHESNVAFLSVCRESAAYAANKLHWHVINCAEGDNPKSIAQIHSECMKLVTGDTHFIC